MKKKMTDMKKELEDRFQMECKLKNVKYLGIPQEKGDNFPAQYRKFYDSFEKRLTNELIEIT